MKERIREIIDELMQMKKEGYGKLSEDEYKNLGIAIARLIDVKGR